MKVTAQPPQRVPVLTEVVVLPKSAPEVIEEYPPIVPDPAYAETAPAPLGEWPSAPQAATPAPAAAAPVRHAAAVGGTAWGVRPEGR